MVALTGAFLHEARDDANLFQGRCSQRPRDRIFNVDKIGPGPQGQSASAAFATLAKNFVIV